MANEKDGGFLLTDLEAANLYLFAGDILGKFHSSEDYCKWVNPGQDDSAERVMATSIIVHNLVTNKAFSDYIQSLDPKETAKQTMLESSKIVFMKQLNDFKEATEC